MTSKYSIKINFDKTLMENPERVFEAMASMSGDLTDYMGHSSKDLMRN